MSRLALVGSVAGIPKSAAGASAVMLGGDWDGMLSLAGKVEGRTPIPLLPEPIICTYFSGMEYSFPETDKA